MQTILATAELADFEFLVRILCDRYNFINDKDLRAALQNFAAPPSGACRQALAEQIEHELRYAGSADLAYVWRWLIGREPGVKVEEIIDDVTGKLGVRCRRIGTVPARLQSLVKGVVEKTFLRLKPEDQRRILESQGINPDLIDEILARLKEGGKLLFLPLLFSILGKQLTAKLLTNVAMQIIVTFVGREAAKQILRQLILKFPWWAEWIGPIAWTVSIGWFVIDMQGPAYRITAPVLVYLGLISLRNGPEEGENFWTETDER
jgi:uncharacterized protein YaaW (UPF0174 family)